MDQQFHTPDRKAQFDAPQIRPAWRMFCGRHAPHGEQHIHCFRCHLVFWGPDRFDIRAQHERASHGIR